MMTVLHQLRTHLERPRRFDPTIRFATIALLCVLTWATGKIALHRWTDYYDARPVETTLLRIGFKRTQGSWDKRIFVFDRGRFVRPPVQSKGLEGHLLDLLNGRAIELDHLSVGDRTTVWVSPDGRTLTPSPRMPLGLTATPVVLLVFLILLIPAPRNRTVEYINRCLEAEKVLIPPGCRERVIRHADGSAEILLFCMNNAILATAWIGGGSLALMFIAFGLLGSFKGDEWIVREASASILLFLILLPVLAAMGSIVPAARVALGDRIRINGFALSKDDRLVIHPNLGGAELRVSGGRSKSRHPLYALWVAGIVEARGIPVEFEA